MDIETVIAELKQVMDRRTGKWPETLRSAPGLLELPRYRAADDGLRLLMTDIVTAIARLPEPLQRDANVLLDITDPRPLKKERWTAIGAGDYSSDARRWRRINVSARIAVELLKRAGEHPSYRMQSVDVHATHEAYGSLLGAAEYTRTIRFQWTLECTVSDLRLFAFKYRSPKPLKFSGFVSDSDTACEATARVSVADSADTHWYLMFLADSLPVGIPTTLAAYITYHKADKASPRIDYIPETPMRTLSMSIQALSDDTVQRCVAWDDESNQELREYKARISSETVEIAGNSSEMSTSHFKVRSPLVGRRFSLVWGKGPRS